MAFQVRPFPLSPWCFPEAPVFLFVGWKLSISAIVLCPQPWQESSSRGEKEASCYSYRLKDLVPPLKKYLSPWIDLGRRYKRYQNRLGRALLLWQFPSLLFEQGYRGALSLQRRLLSGALCVIQAVYSGLLLCAVIKHWSKSTWEMQDLFGLKLTVPHQKPR